MKGKFREIYVGDRWGIDKFVCKIIISKVYFEMFDILLIRSENKCYCAYNLC